MAAVCKIGPTTDFYDFTDRATNGHLFIRRGGVKNTQWDDKEGVWIEAIELAAHSTTHANIVNYEEDIVDHLKNGELFATDKQNYTPVWYYESATDETAKRALVHGGTLKPIIDQNATRLLERDKAFYMLTIKRGPWEQTSASTEISASTMDGNTNTVALTTIKGDVPGRISQTLIRGTSTNTEAAPLTKVWAGIRREYGGVSLFDPLLALEYAGTIENETTVAAIGDSNTYGDTGLLVTFADTVYERRATLSLLDAFWGGQLVTNGGAEEGDLTGWTEDFAGWAADDSSANSGSYGFYSSVSADTHRMHQHINVNENTSYMVSYYYQVYAVDSGVLQATFSFYDSDSGIIAGYGKQRRHNAVNSEFSNVEVVVYAPTDAATMTVELNNTAAALASIESAVDDLRIYSIKTDHYRGSYTALARAKLTAAGDVDIAAKFGYTSSSALNPIGSPQKVTNTDWKLIPLGNVTFPPGRMLSGVDSALRMANLGFEIYAQKIADSDACNLYLDAIVLVPSRHALFVDGCSICRSSYTDDDSGGAYSYADLDVRVSEADEVVILAEAADFLGINAAILPAIVDWEIPNEDGVFVCFAERTLSHQIADDFVVTVKYVPRYDFRNTD